MAAAAAARPAAASFGSRKLKRPTLHTHTRSHQRQYGSRWVPWLVPIQPLLGHSQVVLRSVQFYHWVVKHMLAAYHKISSFSKVQARGDAA
jgi:hypothetical protein